MTSQNTALNEIEDVEIPETGSTMTSYEDNIGMMRNRTLYRLRRLPYLTMIATMIPLSAGNVIFTDRRRYETETVGLIEFYDEEIGQLDSAAIFPLWPRRQFFAFSKELPLKLLPPRRPFIFE